MYDATADSSLLSTFWNLDIKHIIIKNDTLEDPHVDTFIVNYMTTFSHESLSSIRVRSPWWFNAKIEDFADF